MNRIVSCAVAIAVITTQALAGYFPPRAPLNIPVAAVNIMGHFAAYPPVADQQTIGNFFTCNSALPAQSLFWVNGYAQDVATWNWANLGGPRINWPGAIWNLDVGGYRGDGSTVYGDTGLYPGGYAAHGIAADSNIVVAAPNTSVEISDYVVSDDQITANPAAGAGGVGGNNGLLIEGAGSNSAITRILDSNNSSISLKTFQGFYESTINPSNPVPGNIYTIKDVAKSEAGPVTPALPADASPFWIYGFPAEPVFGQITLGAVGYGAGDTVAQQSARADCVTALLVGLNVATSPVQFESLPAFYGNPWSSYPAYGTTAPTKLYRDGCSPPEPGDTKTTFACFPGTDYHNRSVSQLVAGEGGGTNMWWRDWYDRWNYISCSGHTCNKPNPDVIPQINDASGVQYAMEYTTEANADACTLARLDYVNSDIADTVWQGDVTSNGATNTYLLYATAAASPTTYFTFTSQDGRAKVTHDICIMPPQKISFSTYMAGAYIDYEVDDGRTDVAGVDRWANRVHAFTCVGSQSCKTFFGGDTWDGGNIANSGLSPDVYPANVQALFNAFTYVDIYLPGGELAETDAQELQASVQLLQGALGTIPKSQIAVYFGITSTDQDALDINTLYNGGTVNGFSWGGWGVTAIQPEHSGLGGNVECLPGSSNKEIAELLWGSCP